MKGLSARPNKLFSESPKKENGFKKTLDSHGKIS